MITRRDFVTLLTAGLVAVKAGLCLKADNAPLAHAATPALDTSLVEEFRQLHLRHKHAAGSNAERFQINREMIVRAHFLKEEGVPLATIRQITHQALAMAKADFGTARDPFKVSSDTLLLTL